MKTMRQPLSVTALFLSLIVGLGPTSTSAQETEAKITFNFRGAEIETVLNYLSEAAGFIIVMETDVRGEINAWSNQPITTDDAVDLLDTLLADKGYAVVRNNRILKIVDQDEAKKYNLPVKKGSDPEQIPANDSMVTQIIPVRYADATQLVQDLEPLLPSDATLTANQSSNALVLTDRQASIKRMAEIIVALDTSISSISTIKVFPLQFADAKELAEVIGDIFKQPEDNSSRSRSGRGGSPFARFGFGGDRGGRGGGGGGDNNTPSGPSEARQAASQVIAVADERTNSLVVSAPDQYMATIEEVVRQVDRVVDDITEIAVFTLQHADAQETAQILTNLFDDQSDNNSNVRFGGRGGPFGRGGFPGGFSSRGASNNSNNNQSQRLQQQQTVTAVADARTNSVVVSASAGLMEQIANMVEQLDSDNSRKQKVYVYSLEHADADNVAEILRGMFEDRLNGTSRAASRQNTQQNNPLNNRTVNAQGFGAAGGN